MYKNELVRQKLDTAVSSLEISEYYNSNTRNFELKDNIARVVFTKFEADAPGLDKVRLWYKSSREKDIEEYKAHCYQYAISYSMDDTSWIAVDNLLREVPVGEEVLQKKMFHEVVDSSYFYFVAVKEIKVKESISPLNYERENIKQIMIHKIKVTLLKEMETNVYQEALKKNDFEIYESKN